MTSDAISLPLAAPEDMEAALQDAQDILGDDDVADPTYDPTKDAEAVVTYTTCYYGEIKFILSFYHLGPT